jgi:hypothetical protein
MVLYNRVRDRTVVSLVPKSNVVIISISTFDGLNANTPSKSSSCFTHTMYCINLMALYISLSLLCHLYEIAIARSSHLHTHSRRNGTIMIDQVARVSGDIQAWVPKY